MGAKVIWSRADDDEAVQFKSQVDKIACSLAEDGKIRDDKSRDIFNMN
jgi:hypothetical protein